MRPDYPPMHLVLWSPTKTATSCRSGRLGRAVAQWPMGLLKGICGLLRRNLDLRWLARILQRRPPEQSPLAAALSVAVVPWYVVLHKGGWVGGWCEICSVLYLSSICLIIF